jgi:hypothetical protein
MGWKAMEMGRWATEPSTRAPQRAVGASVVKEGLKMYRALGMMDDLSLSHNALRPQAFRREPSMFISHAGRSFNAPDWSLEND